MKQVCFSSVDDLEIEFEREVLSKHGIARNDAHSEFFKARQVILCTQGKTHWVTGAVLNEDGSVYFIGMARPKSDLN